MSNLDAVVERLEAKLWLGWISHVMTLWGKSIDGVETRDGYSIEMFRRLYLLGLIPQEAVQAARSVVRGLDSMGPPEKCGEDILRGALALHGIAGLIAL